MESVVTLQELAKREAAKEKAERLARVKALSEEGMRVSRQAPMKKARGGSVKAKGYFSPY